MSSLEQQHRPDNQQMAELEIERGQTKIRLIIPERPFLLCVLLLAATTAVYFVAV